MTTQAILNILNPCRLLTVSEWMEIASQIIYARTGGYVSSVDAYQLSVQQKTIDLMQSWEQLTRGKWHEDYSFQFTGRTWQPALLTKSMFVCEVEKPTDMYNIDQYYGAEMDTYSAAQREVIFEGFEASHRDCTIVSNDNLLIEFGSDDEVYVIFIEAEKTEKIKTMHELIFFIDRYNRTATKKIELNFTEHFVNKLLTP